MTAVDKVGRDRYVPRAGLFSANPDGKTDFLKEARQQLLLSMADEEIAITAANGVAADRLGGSTLHLFAGVDCFDLRTTNEDLLTRIASKPDVVERLSTLRVLMIDEATTLSGELLDALVAPCPSLLVTILIDFNRRITPFKPSGNPLNHSVAYRFVPARSPSRCYDCLSDLSDPQLVLAGDFLQTPQADFSRTQRTFEAKS